MSSTLHLDTLEDLVARCPERDGIPAFLKIPQAERAAAWIEHPPQASTRERYQDERWEAIKAEDKRKRAESLAKLKEQHAGERYDRKTKQWVTATVKRAVTTGPVTPAAAEQGPAPLDFSTCIVCHGTRQIDGLPCWRCS